MRASIVAASGALALLAAIALWALPSEGETRKRIVDTARSFKGVPYVYGAKSPEAFDCSGFVQYVYERAADIGIPRDSKRQWAEGSPVDRSAAKPGDVLVFDTIGGGGPSHVAIFLGDDSMIHAVSEGPRTGVVVSPMNDRYFGPRLIGARYFIMSAAAESAAKAASASERPASAVEDGPIVSQVGFVLRSKPELYADRIPAATGTAIAFTIENGTGKKGVFHIFFYKADADFKKTRILREDRQTIPAGGSVEIAPYLFTEPGIYRLNVKTSDNTQLMQRTWKVVDLKR